MFKVKRYSEENKKEWDTFVASAKNATFLFQRGFMDYHSDRFHDFSLLVYKNEKLTALLPANKNGTTVFSHQGLTYGSLILQKSAKLSDGFQAFKAVLQFLNSKNIEKLDIRIIPSFYNDIPSDELEYFMFRANATLVNRDLIMVIDYQNQLSFQKNRREGINKAKRNNLEIRIDNDFDIFWNSILIPNLLQKHNTAPVHSLDEIKLLAARFPTNIVQVNVYKEEEIVAGTTVFLTKNVVHPQYVSANRNKNSLGSLDFLYDFVINHFKENRRYFSFNTSRTDDDKALKKGLIFWKEGCGARPYIFNNYILKTEIYKTLETPLV